MLNLTLIRSTLASALCVGIVLFAGCTSRTPTTTSTASATATATSTPGAAATEVERIAPPVVLTGNACVDWPVMHQRSVVALTGTSGQLRRGMPQFLNDIAKFQQSVPAAQRADVEVFANAWVAIGRELQRIDYDLLKLATDPATRAAVQQGMGASPVGEAMTRLDAWSKATCPPAASATPAR